MKKKTVLAVAMLALVLFLGFGGLFLGESHTSSTAIRFVHADDNRSGGGGTGGGLPPPCPPSDPGCDD